MSEEKTEADAKEVISEVAKESLSTDEKKVEETTQLVVFVLDQEEYGIDINELKEIIKIPDITPVPNTPAFIKGILNLRGKIVVVIDLEQRFKLHRDDKAVTSHVVIIEKDDNVYGILVDKVEEVLRVPISQIKAVPQLLTSKIHSDYLKGVVSLEDQVNKDVEEDTKEESNTDKPHARLIILLNPDKILEEQELLSLEKEVKAVVNKSPEPTKTDE